MSTVEETPKQVVDRILNLFAERGADRYGGEDVSQKEHALQAGYAAEQSGCADALVVAALLHDIGHLLHDLPEDCADQGIDDHHENAGANWLKKYFGPEVTDPVSLHVDAKRYLCATEEGYFESLSPASVTSLNLQGGPFDEAGVEEFRRHPHFEAAVALRRFDEAAKVEGMVTPDLEHYRRRLESLVRTAATA